MNRSDDRRSLLRPTGSRPGQAPEFLVDAVLGGPYRRITIKYSPHQKPLRLTLDATNPTSWKLLEIHDLPEGVKVNPQDPEPPKAA